MDYPKDWRDVYAKYKTKRGIFEAALEGDLTEEEAYLALPTAEYTNFLLERLYYKLEAIQKWGVNVGDF